MVRGCFVPTHLSDRNVSRTRGRLWVMRATGTRTRTLVALKLAAIPDHVIAVFAQYRRCMRDGAAALLVPCPVTVTTVPADGGPAASLGLAGYEFADDSPRRTWADTTPPLWAAWCSAFDDQPASDDRDPE